MFRSLRSRMAISQAIVLAVILVVLGGVGQYVLARNLDRSATDELRTVAKGQVHRIEEAGRSLAPIDSDVPSEAGVKLAVYSAPDGIPVGEQSEIPSWLNHYPQAVTDLRASGERVRVVTLPAFVHGTVVGWVSAGRSLLPEQQLIHRVRLILLVGGGLAVLAALGAGWWLSGRAVRPVQRAYDAQAGFAADASHELRTPLTFIRSGVEVMAERDPDLGGDVLSEIDYLTGLTQRLLSLARTEGGSLEAADVDLAEVCRSAARRSESAHGNRLSLEGQTLVVSADRVGLEAAIDAVLENVERHGGGSADLGWGRRNGEGILTIADHGAGIPPQHAGQAFERFFRADSSRTRATGGAGLGLALARTLIEAQGGRMWIEATPGGGLTAQIALPVP